MVEKPPASPYGDEDEDDDEEDSEAEDVPQSTPRPNAVYNAVALHERLEEIGWPENIDWIHTLSLTCDQPGEIDVNDDLAREMAFYTQALEGTRQAYLKLQDLGLPFLRPADYYAEMVKSDSHMLKIKDSLLSQQKQIEETEERRKSREAKRFSKEVQAQKLKERAQQKKQSIESVKKWRKMRQDQGFDKDVETHPPVEALGEGGKKRKHPGGGFKSAKRGEGGMKREQTPRPQGAAPWDRSGGRGKGKQSPGAKTPGSKSRQFRNAKYGHGGKKSHKKANTAESSAGLFGHKGHARGKR